MAVTITYDEKVKGWTSFHSFIPEEMVSLNGRFFSFKDGQLYLHNDDSVNRNNFYGVDYPSKLAFMVNESPSIVKEMKALKLEGNASWDTLIRAYISDKEDFIESSIAGVEFIQEEGMWYAYTRKNEDATSLDPKAAYGIGKVTNIAALVVTFDGENSKLCVGDSIIKSDLSVVGTIQSMDIINKTLTLDTVTGLVNDDFIIGKKDTRIEGSNLRGYSMRVDLENNDTTKVELFAVDSETIKSFI